MFSFIMAIITGLAVIALDQFSKYYILTNFELNVSHEFLPNIIDITYIQNGGGAWGMLSGYTWLLLSMTIVVMLICVTLLIKFGIENKLMFWAICLVLGGGIGNMIDRIFREGNVVDFIHLSFYPQFPVFNIADIAIVIGAGLLVLYFIKSTIDDSKNQKMKKISAEETIENAED